MSDLRATAGRDRRILVRAEEQFGIVDLADLVSLGIDKRAAWRRVRRGTLHRVHLGVYSVVPPSMLTHEGRWLAGVRASGESGGLSHWDAAALWQLRRPSAGVVHTTVRGDRGRRGRSGLVVHRSRSLRLDDVTVESGIRVTTPGRTLRDMRRLVSRSRFEELLRRAEERRLDTGAFGAVEDPDRNEIERRLLALCRRHRIPLPRTQIVIGPYTVDFLWPDAGLIVETDGWETHGTHSAFQADRARDAWLATRGYRVVRFTWAQLHDDPAFVVSTLRSLLGLGP